MLQSSTCSMWVCTQKRIEQFVTTPVSYTAVRGMRFLLCTEWKSQRRAAQLALQVLALIGLRASKELLQRNLAIIEANIEAFTAFCVHHKDVLEFCAPAAGSIAFARLLTREPIEAFCERLVAEYGEASRPVTLCSLWL